LPLSCVIFEVLSNQILKGFQLAIGDKNGGKCSLCCLVMADIEQFDVLSAASQALKSEFNTRLAFEFNLKP